jgi:hypothetical protein
MHQSFKALRGDRSAPRLHSCQPEWGGPGRGFGVFASLNLVVRPPRQSSEDEQNGETNWISLPCALNILTLQLFFLF